MRIPKTKHAYIIAGGVLVVLLALLIALLVPSGTAGISGTAHVGAVGFAYPPAAYGVVSENGRKSEEELRAGLIAQLKMRSDLEHTPLTLADGPAGADTVDSGAIAPQGDISGETPVREFRVQQGNGSETIIAVPLYPVRTAEPHELTSSTVGVSVDGAVLLNIHAGAYDSLRGTDILLGYALDGFGIYPDQGATDLDECGGRVSRIFWEGQMTEMYHYELSSTSPRVLGCFAGTPVGIEGNE